MPTPAVPAYALAVISDVRVTDELLTYMAAVETTMLRFGGRWISHGRTPELLEGSLPGDCVIIEFPDLATARAWYESEEYQEVIPLRTRNCHAVVALIEGVPSGYSTHDTIRSMRGTAVS